MNDTSSPIVGELGSVIVNAPPFVFTKYPSPATAVNVVVLTACQSVPAAIVTEEPRVAVTPFNVIDLFASLAFVT